MTPALALGHVLRLYTEGPVPEALHLLHLQYLARHYSTLQGTTLHSVRDRVPLSTSAGGPWSAAQSSGALYFSPPEVPDSVREDLQEAGMRFLHDQYRECIAADDEGLSLSLAPPLC